MLKQSLARCLSTVVACSFILGCDQRGPATPSPASRESSRAAPRPWADSTILGPEAEIYRTWIRYLDSKKGQYSSNAGLPSPYWLAAEQQQWRTYDLAAFYLYDFTTPEVRSIQPDPDVEGEYRIVTLFHSEGENNSMRSRTVRMTVFALRSNDGWVFANALPRLTRKWRRERLGPITYVMEPGYAFDRGRAERAVAFVDSLATTFGVPRLERLTYFLTSTVDEVYRIIGLETDKKWGPVGGVAQPMNRQLFSGIPAVGEDNRHELTHMVIMPLLMTHPTTFFVSEGVPTWLGGTTGMDFPTAARGLATFLAQHVDVTLDSIMTGQFPAQIYTAAGVFVMMTFEQAGLEGVKGLFEAGPSTEDFRAAMERMFKRPWSSIAADWHVRALSFAPHRGGPP